MKKNFALFIFFALLTPSCSALALAPTLTPTQTATPIPTFTSTPAATFTPELPTETPNVFAAMLPSGNPVREWKGIPIMPGALAGKADAESYAFTIKASVEEVQAYYEMELPKLGWTLMMSGTGEKDAVMLIFNNGIPPLLPISIIRQDDWCLF